VICAAVIESIAVAQDFLKTPAMGENVRSRNEESIEVETAE
jgi:hypothetical protein